MTIIEHFLTYVQKDPEKTAVITSTGTFSYGRIFTLVQEACTILRRIGVTRGTHVGLILDNGVDFTVSLLACAELGIVLVPFNPTMKGQHLQQAIRATECTCLLGQNRYCRNLLGSNNRIGISPWQIVMIDRSGGWATQESVMCGADESYVLGTQRISGDQDFILTMTSGSTGNPKPIMISQETKLRRALAGARDLYGLRDDEVILTASPMYHSLGMRLAMLPLLIGGTSVILEYFSKSAWLDSIAKYQVTFTIAVSTHLEIIAEEFKGQKYDLSSMRTLVSSSALLRPEVRRIWRDAIGCDLHECYGCSEIGIATDIGFDEADDHLNSVGRPLPYVALRILDDNHKKVLDGKVGTIFCRSETEFSGYYGNETATDQAMIDGFFDTGDLGHVDDDGFLYLHGRKKDLIIVGGINVYPQDIEEIICKDPYVRGCAVIGVRDSYFGEAILAVIETATQPADLTSRLRKLCRENLADYQQPHAYEFVDRIPRNTLGKIMKLKLREKFVGYDATRKLRRMLLARP